MIQLTDNIYAVEVPHHASEIEICNYGLSDSLEYVHLIDGVSSYSVDDLPPGTWQFLFTTKEVTEEYAKLVVETEVGGFTGNIKGFKDYEIVGCDISPLLTALLSFQSLLRSKGCDMSKNYAIIQKQNDNG